MKQEQSSLERGYDAIAFKKKLGKYTKKALADQKQKYRDMLENSLKLCGYCKHQILREFEEL